MSNEFELPENVAMMKLSTRCWNGMNVSLAEYTCTGRVLFHLEKNQDSARIGAELEYVGRHRAELRSAPNIPNSIVYRPRPIYFAPAEMELWGHSGDACYLKCGGITFDVDMLQERLGISDSLGPIDVPRLRFSDDRLWTLIKFLKDSINDSYTTAQLYGD